MILTLKSARRFRSPALPFFERLGGQGKKSGALSLGTSCFCNGHALDRVFLRDGETTIKIKFRF